MIDRTTAIWRKSTRSNDQGLCVEVAIESAAVGVRDSKDKSGPILEFRPAAWQAFMRGQRPQA